MNTINRILMPLLLTAAAAPQGDGRFALSCWLTPDSQEETLRLGNAPHRAKRVEKHRLEVSWVGGRQTVVNKPPYDEPVAGSTLVYCGFDARLNLHLFLKRDERLFTGVLLDDRIGGNLRGGQTVMFSPDRRYYLAYDQPDGQDGKTIKLYTRSGVKIWEDYNGILSRDGKSVVTNFELLPTLRGCTGTATIGYRLKCIWMRERSSRHLDTGSQWEIAVATCNSAGSKEIPGNPNSHTPSLVRAFRFPVVCCTSMQKG